MTKSLFASELWAESWERRAPLVEHLVPLLMEELRPRAGEKVLDAGTGLAPAAIAAALAVLPDCEVHAVDISAPILRVPGAQPLPPGLGICTSMSLMRKRSPFLVGLSMRPLACSA